MIEFGLVGQTMHQIDERTPVADLVTLTDDLSGGCSIEYFGMIVIPAPRRCRNPDRQAACE